MLENQRIEYRDDDSHDVRGTFHAILESKNRPFPATVEAFKDQLVAWNRQVIFSRASKRPGEWKTVANRAGDTPFAAPELVQGTLTKGFETICAASTPAIKAALAMFVVAEVHPFADGNGRTARPAMNLVLSSEGLVRIIVPTVYRDDYWSALHALSHSPPDEKPYPRTDAYRWAADRTTVTAPSTNRIPKGFPGTAGRRPSVGNWQRERQQVGWQHGRTLSACYRSLD